MSRLSTLLRISGAARRLGLGPLVDRVRPVLLGRLGRSSIEVDGFTLYGETVEDRLYFDQLRMGRERFMFELFERSLKPGMVVADVGAHLGLFSLLAARRVGAGGAVIAFEPNPDTLLRLHANVTRNRAEGVIRVVPSALSDAADSERFYLRAGADVSSLYDDEPYEREVVVEAIRGDDFFAGQRPFDVLKLDVEGAEPAALAGLGKTLDRPGVKLFVECNPSALASAGSDPVALVSGLRERSFEVWAIDEEERRLRPFEDARLEPYANLLCER